MNQSPAVKPNPQDETFNNPWADLVVSTCFLLIEIAIFFYARHYTPKTNTLGPQSFPRLLAVLTIPLCLLMMVRSIRLLRQTKSRDIRLDSTNNGLKSIAIAFAVSVLYIVSMAQIGYVLSSILFLGFFIRFLGERRWWLNAIVSICVTLVLYYVFDRQLNVPLPRGWFE